MDSGQAGNVHRIRNADAIRRSERLTDQRLPGDDPDDRRVGSVLPGDDQRPARRRAGTKGLLRRLHRQHAHRRSDLHRRRSDHQRSAGKRCARRIGEADADLARRSQPILVRLDLMGRRETPVQHQPGSRRDGPAGDGAQTVRERRTRIGQTGHHDSPTDVPDDQGCRLRVLRRSGGKLHRDLLNRFAAAPEPDRDDPGIAGQ